MNLSEMEAYCASVRQWGGQDDTFIRVQMDGGNALEIVRSRVLTSDGFPVLFVDYRPELITSSETASTLTRVYRVDMTTVRVRAELQNGNHLTTECDVLNLDDEWTELLEECDDVLGGVTDSEAARLLLEGVEAMLGKARRALGL